MDNNQPDQTPSSEPLLADPSHTPPEGLSRGERVIQPLTSGPIVPEPDPAPTPPQPAPSPVVTSAAVNPGVAPQDVAPQASSGISTAPVASPDSMFIAGSQLAEEKVKLPSGIYIIAGLNLLGFITGFFDTSQTGAMYTVVMFIDLLLAIGLILRYEIARKSLLWLSGLTLIIALASIFLLAGLQQKIKQSKTDYETAISRIDQSRITEAQKQQLQSINTTLASQEKLAGKAITFTYIKLGVATLEAVGILIYLTRPSVKEIFKTID